MVSKYDAKDRHINESETWALRQEKVIEKNAKKDHKTIKFKVWDQQSQQYGTITVLYE